MLPPVDRVTPVYVLAATSLYMLQGCRLLWQQDVAGPGLVEIPGSLGLPGRNLLLLATLSGVSLVGGDGQCVKCRSTELGSTRLPTSTVSRPPVVSVPASTLDRTCCPTPRMPADTFFCN